jgi:hypothetical protein
LAGKCGWKKQEVRYSAELFSIVPIDHLQIVCNGKVARELALKSDAHVSARRWVDSD